MQCNEVGDDYAVVIWSAAITGTVVLIAVCAKDMCMLAVLAMVPFCTHHACARPKQKRTIKPDLSCAANCFTVVARLSRLQNRARPMQLTWSRTQTLTQA